MNAIEITNLSKTFRGKKRAKIEVLKNLSLTVERGEIFGFLGPNGAGKSTTIKSLMGLVEPSAGSARIMGREITSADARRRVGYLPENPAFYDYLSAQEYLLFVGRSFGIEEPLLSSQAEKVLRQMDLWDARKRPIRTYSKGMVQRVGLAQVLIHDPDVYILDEPMSGLDPIGRALVKEIMLDLKRRGKSVFFSTHITSDVESVCDRVGIILKGVLQSVERVDTILAEGVLGYHIVIKDKGGTAEEVEVAREELPALVAAVAASDREVALVEPKRKSLEDFFLDIVKGKRA